MSDDTDYGGIAEFREALRRFLRATERATASNGLTPAAYDLLVMIGAAGNGGATITSLADRLSLAANSVTELVDRAEAGGLVRRRPDPADRRVTRVCLSASGRKRIAAAVAALNTERTDLLKLLRDVQARL